MTTVHPVEDGEMTAFGPVNEEAALLHPGVQELDGITLRASRGYDPFEGWSPRGRHGRQYPLARVSPLALALGEKVIAPRLTGEYTGDWGNLMVTTETRVSFKSTSVPVTEAAPPPLKRFEMLRERLRGTVTVEHLAPPFQVFSTR